MTQNLHGDSWPLGKGIFGGEFRALSICLDQAVGWPQWGLHSGQSEQDECHKATQNEFILNFVFSIFV